MCFVCAYPSNRNLYGPKKSGRWGSGLPTRKGRAYRFRIRILPALRCPDEDTCPTHISAFSLLLSLVDHLGVLSCRSSPYPPKLCLQGFFSHTLEQPLNRSVTRNGFEPIPSSLKGWSPAVRPTGHYTIYVGRRFPCLSTGHLRYSLT